MLFLTKFYIYLVNQSGKPIVIRMKNTLKSVDFELVSIKKG